MDEKIEGLILELKAKASGARRAAAKLSYKHQGLKAIYNTEATAYEYCVKRLEEARG